MIAWWVTITGVALFLGILAGMLPTLNVTGVLILMMPAAHLIPNWQLLMWFFCVVVMTTQYYGSVSAILFGVVGEFTSVPAVENGLQLAKYGLQEKILAGTAIGSFVGAVIALGIVMCAIQYYEILIYFFSNKIKVTVLIMTIILLISMSNNKIIATVLSLVGLYISAVSIWYIEPIQRFVPNYIVYLGGIPIIPIAMGLLVIPGIVRSNSTIMVSLHKTNHINDITNSTRTIIIGSVVGSLSGLIPGISYTISSSLAETVEKFRNIFNRVSAPQTYYNNILSAETSNNAGAITSLIPLLLLGLPILPSEAIILSLVENKGFVIQTAFQTIKNNAILLCVLAVAVSVINLYISGILYKYLAFFIRQQKKITVILLVTITMSMLWESYISGHFVLTWVTLLISTIVGFAIKTHSAAPILFACLIGNELVPELYRMYI